MVQRPDGKPARTERVTFTRPAADRIAKVVRRVEQGDRGAEPLTFDRVGGGLPYKLQLGVFTGNWETASWTTVTLHQSTQTVSVYNWCNPALGADTSSTSQTRYVIFGKVAGSQWLPGTPNNAAVEMEMRPGTCALQFGGVNLTQLAGYDANEIQLLGHNTTGPCLQWYSITTCSTAA